MHGDRDSGRVDKLAAIKAKAKALEGRSLRRQRTRKTWFQDLGVPAKTRYLDNEREAVVVEAKQFRSRHQCPPSITPLVTH